MITIYHVLCILRRNILLVCVLPREISTASLPCPSGEVFGLVNYEEVRTHKYPQSVNQAGNGIHTPARSGNEPCWFLVRFAIPNSQSKDLSDSRPQGQVPGDCDIAPKRNVGNADNPSHLCRAVGFNWCVLSVVTIVSLSSKSLAANGLGERAGFLCTWVLGVWTIQPRLSRFYAIVWNLHVSVGTRTPPCASG